MNQLIPLWGIKVYDLFILIWFLIALAKLLTLIKKQYLSAVMLHSLSISKKTYLLEELLEQKNIKANISLIEIPQLSTPILTGIIHPKIIISNNTCDEDLYYILLHELQHYRRHDVLLVLIVHLLCIFYWWNPFVYILKNDVQRLIEYQVDENVLKELSKEQRCKYLQSILNIAKQRNAISINPILKTGFYENQSYLVQRFKYISNSNRKKNGRYTIALALIFSLLSTLIIFEPYYIDENFSKDTFSLSGDSYLVKYNDHYDLYIDNKYYLTVDRTDGFENLKIYEEEKYENSQKN